MADVYLIVIAIGLAIAAGYVAISYMLGSFSMFEGLKAYARVEAGELALSLIVVAVVLAAYSAQGDILKAVGADKSITSQSVSQRMADTMEKPLESLVRSLAVSTFRYTKVSSYNYNFQAPNLILFAPTSSASPGAGGFPIVSQLMLATDSSSMTLLLAKSMRLAYLFLDFTFGAMMLPLGFLLRLLPPTRKVGALVLGIALAVHLVFPASVILSADLAAGPAAGAGTGKGFAPSLSGQPSPKNPKEGWKNDRLDTSHNGLTLVDPGDPPASGLVSSKTMQTLYTLGETVGASGICTIGCAAGCAISCLASLAGYGACIAACWPSCMGTPSDPAPLVPGTMCQGIAGMVLWGGQIIFPVYTSIALETGDLKKDGSQIASEYYDPLVNVVMPVAIERIFSVLIMLLIQLSASIVLARNFATALGGEGQIYGMVKLV